MKRILAALLFILITTFSFAQTTSETARIIGSLSSKILAQPTSQSLSATGSIVWQVQNGGFYYLTITNAAAATTAFSATVTFETSPDNTNWTAVNGNPLTGLPGATQAATSTTTAAGLWIIQVPTNGAASYIRARVSAYTSGTVWAYLEGFGQPNLTIELPWTPSVTSGQTISGWIDTKGLSEISLRVSAATTTVVTGQGTNDPSGTDVQSVPVTNDNSTNQSGGSTISGAGTYSIVAPKQKWVRFQVTTTGTVFTVQGATARFGQAVTLNPSSSGVGITLPSVNLTQLNGSALLTGGVPGVLAAGGNVANSAAMTANPLGVGGIVVTTPDVTYVGGDAARMGMTTDQQVLIKHFAPPELDYTFNGVITNSTTASVFKAAAGASIRNYVSGITINTDALGTATELLIRDGAVTSTSVSANVLTSGTHDYKIGDAVIFSSVGSYTGISTATVYYVLTVPSTTTYTLSTTPNGSTLTVGGTGSAVSNRILFRTKLQTAALTPVHISFATPLRGAPNVTTDVQSVTASTGNIYYNIQGFTAF